MSVFEESTVDQGPPRNAEAVIRAAFSNPELMRQLAASYEAERRGDLGTPVKDLPARRPGRKTA